MKRTDKNAFSVHFGDRKWSTVIEFISSREKVFKPFIILIGLGKRLLSSSDC